MRKRVLVVVFVLVGVSMFISQKTNINEKDTVKIKLYNLNPVPKVIDETQKFLRLLSLKESQGRHNVVSKNGYLGLYQFHPRTLREVGMDVSRKRFLRSKKLQDSAMIAYLSKNRHLLRKEILKYSGRKIKGKPITESGILAGAHLAGPDRVRYFLRHGRDVSDSNGARISYYIRKFSGYKLNLEND